METQVGIDAQATLAQLSMEENPEPRVDVSLTVNNTRERAGAEVAQIYVGDPLASVSRPAQELRGFSEVRLEPGASTRVTIELGMRAFAYRHSARGEWSWRAARSRSVQPRRVATSG